MDCFLLFFFFFGILHFAFSPCVLFINLHHGKETKGTKIEKENIKKKQGNCLYCDHA